VECAGIGGLGERLGGEYFGGEELITTRRLLDNETIF
jgi:hypothetical protein